MNGSTLTHGFIAMACIALACIALAGCASTPTATTNSLGMQMVLLPAGEFTMGNAASIETMGALYPAYEPRRLADPADETPAHRVRITRPFYMAKHEVTVGQFRQFVEASGHVPESIADGTGGYGYNAAYDPTTTKRGTLSRAGTRATRGRTRALRRATLTRW